MNLYLLHEKMTKHLFPAYSSEDERFLALALCGEAAELADSIGLRFTDDDIRDEIADVRVYLELLAKCFDVEGDKLKFVPDNNNEDTLELELCIECGLLANHIKKRWRDGVSLKDECIVSLMTIRSVVEALATRYGIEGDKLDQRVVSKLERVVKKFSTTYFKEEAKA